MTTTGMWCLMLALTGSPAPGSDPTVNPDGPPTQTSSAATSEDSQLVTVRIELEDIGAKALANIEGLAEAANDRMRVAYGAAPSSKERGRRVLVVYLSPGPFPDAGDFIVRVEAQLDGSAVGESSPEPCLSCGTSQVVDGIASASTELMGLFPEPERAVVEEPPSPIVEQEPSTDAPAKPRRNGADRLLYAGIGVSVVGVLGLGTGIGLIAVHERSEPNEGQPYIRVTDYRPAGIAVAAVGGAAVATGVALIVVGVRKRKAAKGMAVVPTLAPGFAGAAVVGRF